MADVAAAAGVHQTTVSRALRNDRRLPPATCRRIQRIAESLGYRPHPFVSALIALRRRRHPPRLSATLAFVSTEKVPGDASALHLRGARELAQELGYRVETFVVGPEGLSEPRLNAVLLARNVQGVILASLPGVPGQFELDWSQFCTVAIEYTFTAPAFDRVVHDSYGGMRRILRECRTRGFRRVGVTLSTVGSERTERLNEAAFWTEQRAEKYFPPVPPLILPAWDAGHFTRWGRRHRLQAVITSNAFLREVAHGLAQPPLARLGACVVNVNAQADATVAGIFQDPQNIGRTAARLVIQKIITDDRGAPRTRQTTLTPGQWHEGTSLPAGPARPVAAR